MAYIHEDFILIKISKLKKGDPADLDGTCEITPEIGEAIESVVRELLQDPSLIIEVSVDHQI